MVGKVEDPILFLFVGPSFGAMEAILPLKTHRYIPVV